MFKRIVLALLAFASAMALFSCAELADLEDIKDLNVQTQQFIQDFSPIGYAGAQDVYFSSSSPAASYAGASNIFVGTYVGTCTVLWMDSLVYIPIDASVQGADLYFYMTSPPASDFSLKLTSVKLPFWAEAATLDGFTGSDPSFGAVIGRATIKAGATGYLKITLDAAAVQAWVSAPYQNNGVYIQEDDATAASGTYVAFGSRHQPGGAYRPRLVVRYTP